ncbi:hypothetical protein [Sphingomonas sp.]|jgi:hypothetical protein|uniref:hypothetical protein n=1 Tax=Sphingomonas sp. TaxID=28214 RepID=UPI002ED91727
MIPLLLLIAVADDPLLTTARARLAAEQGCVVDPDSTDITVCGLRHADRFRVPLVVRDAGDPRYETVAAERARLQAPTNPVRELSPFLVGGGMAGVSIGIGFDGSVTRRKPAP